MDEEVVPSHAIPPALSPENLQELEQIGGNHILQTDSEGVILAVSPGVREAFQWPADDMLGRNIVEFVPDIDRDILAGVIEDSIPGLTAIIDFRLMNRRMANIPIHARVTRPTGQDYLLISFHEEEKAATTSPLIQGQAIAESTVQQAHALTGSTESRWRKASRYVFGIFTPTTSSVPSPTAQRRWQYAALVLAVLVILVSALILLTTSLGVLNEVAFLRMYLATVPTYLFLSAAVLMALPRRSGWNVAARTTAAVAAVFTFVEMVAAAGGTIGLFGQSNAGINVSFTEYAILLVIAVGMIFLTVSQTFGIIITSVSQVVGWVVLMPTILIYAYHGDEYFTNAPATAVDYDVRLSVTLLSIFLLLAMSAARPEQPLLASPFMGKGFGTVPIAVLISIIVPAILAASIIRTSGTALAVAQTTSILVVSLGFMFVVMVYLESQRFRDDLRQKEALEEQARQYRLYTDNMADGLLYVRENRIEWLSRSTERLFGWTYRNTRSARLTDKVHPADRDVLAATLRANDPNSTIIVVRAENSDHEYVWTQQTVRPYVNANGNADGSIIIIRDITEQVQAEELAQNAAVVLEHRAKHDTLTGLLNRTEAISTLATLTAMASTQHPVSVIVADVDNFHNINDGVSHEAGDDVLIQLANLLDEHVPYSGLTARAGGDEFLIVLSGIDSDTATNIARNLITAVRSHEFSSGGFNLPITVSIGVATTTEPSPATTVISDADTALTRGKLAAPGTVTTFNREMQQDISERVRIAQALRESIEREEFRAWGQPIRELTTGKVVGYEALARWIPDGHTPIPAKEWVDIAEGHGLMTAIGNLVIADAIRASHGLPDYVYVTLNASGRQLLNPDFVPHLLSLLEQHNARPERFILEVTEATLIDPISVELISDALQQVHDHGLRVYLDDFGTGYSAISHLADFPVDGLKLDQTFTLSLNEKTNSQQYNLVVGVAALAQRLGLSLVAEGVETTTQSTLLQQAGWTHAQGWLYGRPAPFPNPNAPLQFLAGEEPVGPINHTPTAD